MFFLVDIEFADPDAPLDVVAHADLLEKVVLPALEQCKRLEEHHRILSAKMWGGGRSLSLAVEAVSNEALVEALESLPFFASVRSRVREVPEKPASLEPWTGAALA